MTGMALTSLGDAVYLMAVAAGAGGAFPVLNVVWAAALVLMGLGALTPDGAERRARMDGWRVLILPAGFALVARGPLTRAAIGGNAGIAGTLLASATLVTAMVRRADLRREPHPARSARAGAHGRLDGPAEPARLLPRKR